MAFLLVGTVPALGQGRGSRTEVKVIDHFDADGDKVLNNEERKAAREYLVSSGLAGRNGRRGGGYFSGLTRSGLPISPGSVTKFPNATAYDPGVVRTFFLDFANADWESELADFRDTDVDVPARVTVDGSIYPDVGVHFRGNSSFNAVSPGYKRPLNLSFDYFHVKQSFAKYSSFNFLNANEDPTFLRSFLFSLIARDYIPAPKVNLVRVVINSEDWGIYVNQQQFDKDFLRDAYGAKEGARWKVPGNHRVPSGGWFYLGESPENYAGTYVIKASDEGKAWGDFIQACKLLATTSSSKLESVLAPLVDLDEVVKFLALDTALSNRDGFWTKGSDYSIYESPAGKFQMIPHDFNETFRVANGGGANGSQPDPMVLADDPYKPIASKLLSVPSLRTRYLGTVRDIAEKWLDWNKLGPVVQKTQALIAPEVANDTHKLYSAQAFKDGVSNDPDSSFFSSGTPSLRSFVEARRKYLLAYTARLQTK